MDRQRRIIPAVALLLLAQGSLPPLSGQEASARYVLQSNDFDPTTLTGQPRDRWYHWLGADAAVTHLETAIAVDAGQFAGRGQHIDVLQSAALTAIQVKIKRIGKPGPLLWEAGTAWGRDDLGCGAVPAEQTSVNYEQFVTLPLKPVKAAQVFLRLHARSGQCPADYYAVYCTWTENSPQKTTMHNYRGATEVGMAFRSLRPDKNGNALDAEGKPIAEGASMMTRLLSSEAGPGRRQLLAAEESPYWFVESLVAGEDPRRIGLPWPGLKPEPGEIAIRGDWTIQVTALQSPQVKTAVDDLAGFFGRAMRVPLKVVWDRSAKPRPQAITLSAGRELPQGPRRPAGYRVAVGSNGVELDGRDARGLLRAAWHLEELLMLRGGPYLKTGESVREPRYSPRATCASWAGTGELCTAAPVYTDAHLSLISHYGYDAIWLVWCPGPERDAPLPTQIAPGCPPEGTTYQPFTSRLRDLSQRAERYDLQVVLLDAAPHPADDAHRTLMQEQRRALLRDVPNIKTVVLLDEGMGSTRAGVPAWVDTCSLLARAYFDVRPDVRVVAWRYTLKSRTPDAAAWDSRMAQIAEMDPRVGYMANFDSFWMRRRDGVLQRAFDYCISLKSPSDDFLHAAKYLAQQRTGGQTAPRPLWTKIETRFSQESNTQPEIPCMQRWVERYQAVNGFNLLPIEGLIANWYHQGFFPTPVTELFGWMSYTGGPSPEALLHQIARRDFGPGQEETVLAAWADFSEAIWHYPFYYGLSYTMNSGLSQPFWLDSKAVNTRPWRRGFVNSLRTMGMEDAGEGPGSGRECRARMRLLQEHWHRGMEKLRGAVDAAPPQARRRAESHWRIAASFGYSADTTLRLVRWFDARDKLDQARSPQEAAAALDELEAVGRVELAAAEAALPVYLCDSRLGHFNHGRGCFTALSVVDKIVMLRRTLDEELPALRRARLTTTNP